MVQLFKSLVLPFILIALLAVIVVLCIKIDVLVLKNGLTEQSLTEHFQQLLLLCSFMIFAWSAKTIETSRSLFVLVAGFFACMYLREMDYYFDIIAHGFWLYPTLFVAALSIGYSLKNRATLTDSTLLFKDTKAYTNLLVGLVILLILSRLFGSSSLWKEIMGDNYQHLYKTVIQEGLELFGYLFIFVGSVFQYIDVKKQLKDLPRSLLINDSQAVMAEGLSG
ncbi:MAG: hypothetical protein HRU20_09035 [Pseudomonadales bacterium]|nr:hypothetical protein [Pseudomonadales bacterium]